MIEVFMLSVSCALFALTKPAIAKSVLGSGLTSAQERIVLFSGWITFLLSASLFVYHEAAYGALSFIGWSIPLLLVTVVSVQYSKKAPLRFLSIVLSIPFLYSITSI
ncbi:hypothetical protein NI389_19605 (plasmid) [Pseudoalteromonas xiamenensis]|uniref:hypothetical protein n=1 Tax=Pseudoalteromonas xiamenensis TaxID=882626 RepID=UPI0027E587C1|nr:hypothetical protein [Pseudoalteromonas xiamenensis]WMN62009.1 hypothetical protein NI389_19605 [Pseudoalteromonas xiamenensis]